MKICKTAFISLHEITPNRLRRLKDLKVYDKTPVDMRGKKRSSNAIPGEVCIKMFDRISSYDVKTSHYSGKTLKYLDAQLNIKILYDTFCNKHPGIKVS